VSCYDITGCDLSFGTWLATTTRAKRRRRERAATVLQKATFPHDSLFPEKTIRTCGSPPLFSSMHAPCFPCTKNIAENPCRSAENCALQYSQIPTTGILAPRLTILRLRFGMAILFPVDRSTLGLTVRGGFFAYSTLEFSTGAKASRGARRRGVNCGLAVRSHHSQRNPSP
jgi:hypothetical protein